MLDVSGARTPVTGSIQFHRRLLMSVCVSVCLCVCLSVSSAVTFSTSSSGPEFEVDAVRILFLTVNFLRAVVTFEEDDDATSVTQSQTACSSWVTLQNTCRLLQWDCGIVGVDPTRRHHPFKILMLINQMLKYMVIWALNVHWGHKLRHDLREQLKRTTDTVIVYSSSAARPISSPSLVRQETDQYY
uniref:Uncharacterized protein n=1 Tax=Physcomitrium patens TaxID=3218 RepID=A0A2K1JHG9_PHYPA|nr:hypothetical protein PHYPA_018391 [Physcomitrium patens]